jgi:hypothetical protein
MRRFLNHLSILSKSQTFERAAATASQPYLSENLVLLLSTTAAERKSLLQ